MGFRNRKRREPLGDELFCPVSQQVQINFVFIDHVRILCLSCNVKKSKTTTKIAGNIGNRHNFNNFQWCPLHLYCYRFLVLLYMNLVTVNLYSNVLINFDLLAFISSNLSIQYKNLHWANTAKTSPIRIFSVLTQFQSVQ